MRFFVPPKENKYSILTVIEIELPVLESSTRITYLMAHCFLTQILKNGKWKLNTKGIRNGHLELLAKLTTTTQSKLICGVFFIFWISIYKVLEQP